MKQQKILLFGGSGFLGSKLNLVLKSYTIITPSHTQLDLLQTKKVLNYIERIKPDSIIYAAGITRIDTAEAQKELAFALNAEIPKQIAQFVSPRKIPFLYISTDAVFDGYPKKYLFQEEDNPNPKSIYGKSKLAGEEAILEANSYNSVIRLITLFGIDYDRPNFLTKTLKDLQEKKKIYGIVDQVQNPLYVDIAADAILNILNKQLTGIYHLGSLDWDTNYNFIFRFANIFGFDNSLIEKISFKDFKRNKKGHRSKKSILISNRFDSISKRKILRTIDSSFTLMFKNYKEINI